MWALLSFFKNTLLLFWMQLYFLSLVSSGSFHEKLSLSSVFLPQTLTRILDVEVRGLGPRPVSSQRRGSDSNRVIPRMHHFQLAAAGRFVHVSGHAVGQLLQGGLGKLTVIFYFLWFLNVYFDFHVDILCFKTSYFAFPTRKTTCGYKNMFLTETTIYPWDEAYVFSTCFHGY